ncbi:polysaccharide biosynthesis protein [Lactiplantibacillus plajomi]|uniref:Polysaccharide biosynthesis protein n=1 Tax=Lactiplantibacillus plajomi TaxID=1457217 RepID=A0ABV6K200_9LACO|nr:polysaccharide biosynthesis protein [Lactiplantibacillus plajomi]
MKYQATDRLRLAWRWLPVEVLIIVGWCVVGWFGASALSKPVYQAQMDIEIKRRLPAGASTSRRHRQLKKDIKNVDQFSVLPHQSGVLYQAGEYASMHYGIWQSVRSLSESVTAEAVDERPVLRVTVASSSRAVAAENRQAFRIAIRHSLRGLRHYRVRVVRTAMVRENHVMRKPILKFTIGMGFFTALVTPYVINYLRGKERDGHV